MTKIVAIIAPKGGSGKTTIAVNLACALGAVILDADPQGSADMWAKSRGDPEARPEVIKVAVSKLDAACAAARTTGIKYAIIDTAGRASLDAIVAAKIADLILIPTRPAFYDIATLGVAHEIIAGGDAAERAYVILNAMPPNAHRRVAEIQQLIADMNLTAAPHIIHQRAAFAHTATGGNVLDGKTRAGKEIKQLAAWISRTTQQLKL